MDFTGTQFFGTGKRFDYSESTGFGSWEKHEKGVASKIMAKMGYKGGGLGKNAEGVAEPIQVQVRPKAMGLGFNDFQERTAQSFCDFGDEDDEDWGSFSNLGPSRKKNIFKTGTPQVPYKEKIIDLRGPTSKIINSIEETQNVNTHSKNSLLPQLQYNLSLLVDNKEVKIQTNAQKKTYEENLIFQLQKEIEVFQKQVSEEENKIKRLEDIVQIISKCEEKIQNSVSDENLTLEFLLKIFLYFQEEYLREWQIYQLDLLAFHFVFPRIEKQISAWKPLENPSWAISIITAWQSILDLNAIAKKKLKEQRDRQKKKFGKSSDSRISPLQSLFEEDDEETKEALRSVKDPNRVNVYQQIFYTILFPKFRYSILHEWNPRDYSRGTKLIATWAPILPSEVLHLILDQLIMPKLSQEVKNWNPLRDTQLISYWLHPWVPILGDRMESLWEPIRIILARVLVQWQPSDETAYIMLSPWKDVFSEDTFDAFLSRTILPKLEELLRTWVINPQNQDITPWNWICKWAPLFKPSTFMNFLIGHFFPKWFNTLHTWLLNEPNLEEVMRWYIGWKKIFPEFLLQDPRIVGQFNSALEMMQSSMDPSGTILPPPRVAATPVRATIPKRKNIPPAKKVNPLEISDISIKEIMEKLAEDNGLLFIPRRKFHEGKPVYGFGNASIFIDKDLIYISIKGKWELTSIEKLLQQAKK